MSQGQPGSWASTPAARKVMQGNRSRDTRPEMALRRAIHALGLRYRVCARPLPDHKLKVDLVFRSARVAVEIRGCFWHACPYHFRLPRTNRDYWQTKIAKNAERDKRTERLLREQGWELVAVWEHEDALEAADRVQAIVRKALPRDQRGEADWRRDT